MNFAPMPVERLTVTDDAILGGKLRLLQPKRGHRVGHDAILLAAAVDAKPRQRVVELGAGVGAAGLALLARSPKLQLVLVEIEPKLCELAAENIARNGFSENARAVRLDASASARSFAAAGLAAGAFNHVLMNPPFNDPTQASPDTLRRKAHAGYETLLQDWVRAATHLLQPSGQLTLIWRADGLAFVLTALAQNYGAIAVLPVHAGPDRPAIRVIVRGIKGGQGRLALLPPLILNDANHRPATEAEAVLRAGASLEMG